MNGRFSLFKPSKIQSILKNYSETAKQLIENLYELKFYEPVYIENDHICLEYQSTQTVKDITTPTLYLLKIYNDGECKSFVRVGVTSATDFTLNEYDLKSFENIDPLVQKYHETHLEPLLALYSSKVIPVCRLA